MHEIASTTFLRAFRTGQKDAFEKVFNSYYKQLRIEAFLLLKNEKDAEDQVQQLFLDLWNRQLYRNVQESIKGYLHTSIRNRCLNYIEKKSYEHKMMNGYAASFCDAVYQDERENQLPLHLQSALNKLTGQRMNAFNLVYIENKKYKDAAREMGISINSIKSHLKLAVKILRLSIPK